MTDGLNLQLHIINRQKVAAPDPYAEKRHADQEGGRQVAQKYAVEALLAAVNVMRTSQDHTQVLKAAKLVMDRAWGIPKSASDEDAAARNKSVIEILAEMSIGYAQVTQEKPIQGAIPHEMGLETLLIENDDNG